MRVFRFQHEYISVRHLLAAMLDSIGAFVLHEKSVDQ